MKIILFILSISLLISCSPPKKSDQISNENSDLVSESDNIHHDKVTEEYREDFQMIIDSVGLIGSVLIFDPQSKIYYSNDFKRCSTGFIPASTFKIPNSIIALETGVAKDDSTVFKWDGKKKFLPQWEKDLILKDAFQFSCVPCYQQIAREIGTVKMKDYLKKFDYGNMIVDSSNIDTFWLTGESKISQMQQIDFLKKLYNLELPISVRTSEIMKRIMIIDENDLYKLSGKTGWAVSGENNLGWFVGYIETKKGIFYFATNVEPAIGFNMDEFAGIRKDITLKAFRKIETI
ncbi:MAG TPA: class D beta-lactamase [Ignavibacteria bacterium]|nr:class D beta-lactamase [Ignavibacteria bacterium]